METLLGKKAQQYPEDLDRKWSASIILGIVRIYSSSLESESYIIGLCQRQQRIKMALSILYLP
jgi:hypothetical protein